MVPLTVQPLSSERLLRAGFLQPMIDAKRHEEKDKPVRPSSESINMRCTLVSYFSPMPKNFGPCKASELDKYFLTLSSARVSFCTTLFLRYMLLV